MKILLRRVRLLLCRWLRAIPQEEAKCRYKVVPLTVTRVVHYEDFVNWKYPTLRDAYSMSIRESLRLELLKQLTSENLLRFYYTDNPEQFTRTYGFKLMVAKEEFECQDQ